MVCAICFGKQEAGGAFKFTQAMVDGVLRSRLAVFSGSISAYSPVLTPFEVVRPVLHLTISDENKLLIIQSPELVAFILETLLIDPDHQRQDQDEAVKAAIQADSVECLLQLATFEPGRARLMQETAIIEALHALSASKALTREAKEFADGALLVIEGRTRELGPQRDGDDEETDGHIMISCKHST